MLLILLYLLVSEHALDLRSRRSYFYTLLFAIICVSLDILSIFGIAAAYGEKIPRWAAYLVCKLYVTSLVVQSYEGFVYASNEFFSMGSHRKMRVGYHISCLVGVFLIMILPIDIFMEGRTVYCYGPSTLATYAFALLYIISTIYMAFRESGMIASRRRRTILIWQGIWLLVACIQLFNPELLLVGFGMSFGMVLLYAELENPHEGIDRLTGLYSANVMMDYIRDRFMYGKRFSALSLFLMQEGIQNDMEMERQIFVHAANYLNSMEKAHVFRNVGSELMLVFPNEEEMSKAFEKIRQELKEVLPVSVKLHYMVINDSTIAQNADEFLDFHRMLVAEAERKPCVVMDQEAIRRIREQAEVKDMIHDALRDGRVEVFYQPIYNVEKGVFTSAEALVRIRDKEGKIVPPGSFIPVAENSGLIIPIGEEVFKQVCVLLSEKEVIDLGISYIEVNLSVVQFERENLANEFYRIAESYGIDFSRINLEITETASFSTKKTLLKNMEAMMDWGARFSLDDFGTGRSNLDYFVEMPVDIIKFDYKFTQGYFRNEKIHDVMKGVIEMMKRMGLYIVSEGVETQEQLDAMCRLGVDYIQGYYFSRPVPKNEFLAFLREKNASAHG